MNAMISTILGLILSFAVLAADKPTEKPVVENKVDQTKVCEEYANKETEADDKWEVALVCNMNNVAKNKALKVLCVSKNNSYLKLTEVRYIVRTKVNPGYEYVVHSSSTIVSTMDDSDEAAQTKKVKSEDKVEIKVKLRTDGGRSLDFSHVKGSKSATLVKADLGAPGKKGAARTQTFDCKVITEL